MVVIITAPRLAPATDPIPPLKLTPPSTQDAIAIIPDDCEVEIKDSPFKTSSANLHKSLIQVCNAEISKAILGQTLSTENTGTGSYAATKGHLDVRADIINDDKKMVEQVFNQLIQWICDLNVSDGKYPVFNLYEEEKVNKEKAERDKILSETGLKFKKSYFVKNYGFNEEDFDVTDYQPETNKNFKQFSEPLKTSIYTPQKKLDALIESFSENELQQQIEPILEPIINLIQQSSNYEEILASLAEKYPEMDDSKLFESLAKAYNIAEIWGRINEKT